MAIVGCFIFTVGVLSSRRNSGVRRSLAEMIADRRTPDGSTQEIQFEQSTPAARLGLEG